MSSARPGRFDRFLVSSATGSAATFLFDRLLAPHGRRERWLGALARRSGLASRAALVDGRPEAVGLAEAAAALARLRPAGEWILAGPRPEDRRGRFTGFLFPSGRPHARGARPDRVVKLRREGGAGATLAAEAETLAGLARELPEPLRGTVPGVLDHGRIESAGQAWELLVLTTLPGRSAYVELQMAFLPARRAPRHLRAAGDWLAHFHRATARRASAWSPPSWEEIAPGDQAASPEWYRRLRLGLAEAPWPLAAGHGDFWARNVLLPEPGEGPAEASGRLSGVVDWEHFRPQAPPFDDLFHFALSYGESFPWGGRRRPPEEAFRRSFLADNAVSRELRRYFAAYARETGLDSAALGGLARLFLLTREDRDACLNRYRMLERAERSVFSG
ncbi:MAG TPA: hypothetical protein VMR44_04670 [Thermoanaerobaculia bacterium]|nr:hypothetical protein [Thermoanaerobaculia bacterium]